MYFPLSGVTINPLFPPLAAFVVSFFTSMGGISGAFLLLPLQMSFLHYTQPSVSATNQIYNLVAVPAGVYRYWREGRMVWPLAWIIAAGGLPGVFLGALVRVSGLRDPGRFKAFAALALLFIGIRIIIDLRRNPGKPGRKPPGRTTGAIKVTARGPRLFTYTFQGECFTVNRLSLFALSLFIGMVGGIYGVGGGALIAPILAGFYRLPIHTISGATLFGTLLTSVAGVVFYSALSFCYPDLRIAPDWTLGALFGLGGMLGMSCGARCQKYVPERLVKWFLALIILGLAAQYLGAYFF